MTRKQLFLRNALILTCGSLLLRFLNIGFRSYITQQISAQGMGLYQLIFSLFVLSSTLCTSGAGFTATRLTAEGKDSPHVLRKCCLLALAVSLPAALLLTAAARPMAIFLLNAPEAAAPLCLLAPGLPFMALCSCLKGWFLAKGNTLIPAIGELIEQLFTIAASLFLLGLLPPLEAFMAGSTLGEISSCLLVYLGWRKKQRKNTGTVQTVSIKKLLHIGAPVTCGSFIRSLLSSVENLLIPKGLRLHGSGQGEALSQYGMVQGMVMPLLFFPASFAGSLCTLLIPEMARASAAGDHSFIRRTARRSMGLTLGFSFLVLSVFLALAEPLCILIYKNPTAGSFLKILSPIVPILYLDNVVDGMLKGLDQQAYSFKYNFADSILRILFLSLFLPLWGIAGYISVLFFSEIFNATLSIARLLKVTRLKPDLGKALLPWAIGSLLLYGVLLFLRSI